LVSIVRFLGCNVISQNHMNRGDLRIPMMLPPGPWQFMKPDPLIILSFFCWCSSFFKGKTFTQNVTSRNEIRVLFQKPAILHGEGLRSKGSQLGTESLSASWPSWLLTTKTTWRRGFQTLRIGGNGSTSHVCVWGPIQPKECRYLTRDYFNSKMNYRLQSHWKSEDHSRSQMLHVWNIYPHLP